MSVARIKMSSGVLAALATSVFCQEPVSRDDWKEVVLVERIAADLPFIELGEFLHRRDIEMSVYGSGPGYPNIDRCNDLLRALYASADRASEEVENEVRRLVGDSDPRVRTTAILWLYQRFDPSLLPFFVEQIDDEGVGIPSADIHFDAHNQLRWRMADLTVGQWTRQLLSNYFRDAWSDDARADFVEYWEPRCHRAYCISWIKVELSKLRKRDGTQERHLLEEALAAIPFGSEVERAIYRLAILSSRGVVPALTDEEIVAHCATISAARLIDLFNHQPVIDDPDLGMYVAEIAESVLPRAEMIFDQQHADALARAGCTMNGEESPEASAILAAARINPEKATDYFHDGIAADAGLVTGFAEADLAAELWALGDDTELVFIKNWFLSERFEYPGTATSMMRLFDAILADGPQPRDRKLIRAIVTDVRFASVTWYIVAYLLDAFRDEAPDWSGLETEFKHPFGRFTDSPGSWSDAGRIWPEETQQLRKDIANWRQQLRELVDSW